MQTKLLALLTTAALAWTLPAKQRDAERGRYEAALAHMVEVAFDPAEPAIFAGPAGRVRTAALLASIASYESSFRADVLDGRVKGDHGESVCALQIRVPKGVKILLQEREFSYVPTSDPRGYDGAAISSDPRLCARIALHMVRTSYRRCNDLSGYTSGHCQRDEKRASVRAWRANNAFSAWKLDDTTAEEGTQE
jgi:hypothetical protein